MAAAAPVDAAADAAGEKLARGEASQAETVPAEVCLVGVPHVNRQSRHAVRATPTRGNGAGLSQREEALEPQRPLEDLGTHPHCVQAAAAQLARGECQVGGQAASPVRWIQTVRTTPANPGSGGRST